MMSGNYYRRGEVKMSDERNTDTKQKPITFGNVYCALACPYIKPDKPETLSAECLLDGKTIIYQDWFIAHCLKDMEDDRKTHERHLPLYRRHRNKRRSENLHYP